MNISCFLMRSILHLPRFWYFAFFSFLVSMLKSPALFSLVMVAPCMGLGVGCSIVWGKGSGDREGGMNQGPAAGLEFVSWLPLHQSDTVLWRGSLYWWHEVVCVALAVSWELCVVSKGLHTYLLLHLLHITTERSSDLFKFWGDMYWFRPAIFNFMAFSSMKLGPFFFREHVSFVPLYFVLLLLFMRR